MSGSNVDTFRAKTTLLGPYGFLIWNAISKFPNRATKEACGELVPLPKMDFTKGWCRYEATKNMVANARAGESTMKELCFALAKTFAAGAWDKNELGATDWAHLFSCFDDGKFKIGDVVVWTVGIAKFVNTFFIVVNDKYQLSSGKRLSKYENEPYDIFKYKIGECVDEPEKAVKNKRRLTVQGTPDDIGAWKVKHIVDYIWNLVNETQDSTLISKAGLKQKGIMRAGVGLLGKMLSISSPSAKKKEYINFVDWLVGDSPFKNTLVAGNFVSKSTMGAYIVRLKKKDEAGTLQISDNVDYDEGSEVSF